MIDLLEGMPAAYGEIIELAVLVKPEELLVLRSCSVQSSLDGMSWVSAVIIIKDCALR